jgi:hypothetical protein
LADGLEYRLQQKLSGYALSPEERDFLEIIGCEIDWKRREVYFRHERTALGNHLQFAFAAFVIPELRKLIEDIEVFLNYKTAGFDIYVYVRSVKKWIVIELKNWHPHYDAGADLLNTNFYYRIPYVTIGAKRKRLSGTDILKRVLIFSAKTPISKTELNRLKQNNVMLIQGTETFENDVDLTPANRELLSTSFERIVSIIEEATEQRTDYPKLMASKLYFLHCSKALNQYHLTCFSTQNNTFPSSALSTVNHDPPPEKPNFAQKIKSSLLGSIKLLKKKKLR